MGSNVGLLPPQSDSSDVMKDRNFLKQMRKYSNKTSNQMHNQSYIYCFVA
jgi:hypothetical protein